MITNNEIKCITAIIDLNTINNTVSNATTTINGVTNLHTI